MFTDKQLERVYQEVVIYVNTPKRDDVPTPTKGLITRIDKGAYPQVLDAYNLGVGDYRIVRVGDRDDDAHCSILLSNSKEDAVYWSIGVQPIDFETFDLPLNYINSFELVCQYYLDEVEKDNLQYAQQLGIQYIKDVEDKTIDELRRVLLERHSIETGDIVCF